MPRKLALVILALCAAAALYAQDTPPTEPPAQTPPAMPGAGRGAPLTAEPQPYERVITKEAKSKQGVFTVHQIKEQVLLRNPQERTRQGVPLEFLRSPRPPAASATAASS